jgi:hypothetical protein
MRLATIAALTVLVALPADAVQQRYQTASLAPTCDNGARCTTINAAVPIAPDVMNALESKGATAPAPQPPRANRAAGIVVSRKTGPRARVGVAHAARFQAYIDDLETNHGARVLFMGGVRPGRCSPSSEHPCGKALDVCQFSRGVVDRHCNLPGRVTLGQVAAAHGLFEGGRWCNSDYGHAQVDVTAAGCGERRIRIVQSRSVQ